MVLARASMEGIEECWKSDVEDAIVRQAKVDVVGQLLTHARAFLVSVDPRPHP
jgi:hypothetical protein